MGDITSILFTSGMILWSLATSSFDSAFLRFTCSQRVRARVGLWKDCRHRALAQLLAALRAVFRSSLCTARRHTLCLVGDWTCLAIGDGICVVEIWNVLCLFNRGHVLTRCGWFVFSAFAQIMYMDEAWCRGCSLQNTGERKRGSQPTPRPPWLDVGTHDSHAELEQPWTALIICEDMVGAQSMLALGGFIIWHQSRVRL